jgi:hypothetical protein
MRAGQAILAATIFFCCAAAGAAASPLIPPPSGTMLRSDSGIETVRWRNRHRRNIFWGSRGAATDRDDIDGFTWSSTMRSLDGAPPMASQMFRPETRRRGWVDPPPPR